MSGRNKNKHRPKRRKKTKIPSKQFTPEDKKRLADLDVGSYYDQEGCERQLQKVLSQPPEEQQEPCSSKKKIEWAQAPITSPSESEGEDFVTEDLKGRKTILGTPEYNWIVNIAEFSNYISSIAVCKSCNGKLELFEDKNFRAGLGTRLQL